MTIIGAGGGGGSSGGDKPKLARDGLDSTQYAKIVDLISEGEIVGLKNGHRSIYFNNTPLAAPGTSATYSRTSTTITVTSANHGRKVNESLYLEFTSGAATTGTYAVVSVTTNTFTVTSSASGTTSGNVLWSTYNFQDVEIYTTTGTQNQSSIPFEDAIEDEKVVNVTVTQPIPVVRTITDPNVDAVRVTITWPQFQYFQNDGDVVGTTVTLEIYVQYAGGGFVKALEDTLTGRSGDQYQRDYIVPLTGAKPAEVKVVRVTPDSASSRVQNSFTWATYTEIVQAKLNYPNSAVVGLRVNAEQFSSIPSRQYLVRGIKVAIPSNATVDNTTGRLIYAGIWNGTFGAAQWCSDPAWILWDLLTSTRYGFGDHIDASQLDKWAFYAASQYSNELVPNGFGGTEPRFSCNVNIQTAEEAYKLINDMCSVFRVMPYWSTGALTVSQDKPSDPVYLFTLANVSQEGFTYQSSSQKTRANVAVVSYLDLNIRDIAYEVVENADSIAKNGAVTKEISAFACTSRGQANRIGQWLLYSEQYETEVISFSASIDAGVLVRPGQVIEVADPMRAGQRRGGRITSATTLQIEVDSADGVTAGNNRTLSVILPDGTLETRNVSVVSGRLITVSSAFSQTPNVNSVWIYQTDEIQTSQWRVLSVQEQDGATYAVSALSYDASKYAYIEQDRALQPRDTTDLNELPAAPASIALSETLYYYQGQVRAKVIASWTPVVGVNQYQVHWRKDNGNWTVINKVGPDFEILDITPGAFDFKVYSLSAGLKLSASAATGTINALGKTAPPSDVSGLVATVDPYIGVMLSWAQIADIDASFYEIRVGANWSSATVLTQIQGTTYKVGYLTATAQTFLVKAVDTSGVYSTNAASVSVSFSPPNTTSVTSQIQDPVVVLSWSQPALTSYAIDYYRVTFGNTYATSTEIARTKSTTFSVPVTWSGSRTFWVMPVDLVGVSATTAGSTSVSIVQAAAPTVSGTVSGTTATLTWNAVSGTLATRSYQIRRGTTFSTATVLADITATSYTLRADWSGSQTFWVVAVDGNGNLGTGGSVALTVSGAPAPAVSSTFAGRDVVLSWNAVKGTLDTDYYVIKRGATFGTATTIATAYATTHTLRVDWVGTQLFWVAAVDVNGLVGAAGSDDVIVTAPAAPVITQQVIDNNVLLRWNDVTATLPIEYYQLRKGATWAGATIIGTKQGGFTTVFESQSGTYTYWLAGVDSAGNFGTPGSVSALVNQPPDYVLQLEQNSTWAGEETNIYTDSVLGQIVNANTTETWQSHFTSRSYNSPQDQINAGYTYYLMPTTTTAAYEEEFDAGVVLAGTKITATLTSTNVVGSTTATPLIRARGTTTTAGTYSQSGTTTITVTSNGHGLLANDLVWLDFTSGTAADGTYTVATATTNTFTVTAASAATTSGNVNWVKWTTYAGVNEVYATSFRYFRVRYDFSSSGNNDILVLNSLNVRLDAKIRNDAGTGTANSGDTGGTTVNFNVAFVDVQSISVTPATTSAVFAVYDFVDAPNPTSFKVLLFNTSGTRVSGNFSWSARGV